MKKDFYSSTRIDVRLNDKVVLCGDTKQFIDYLSDSIVEKNSKAILKRNIISQTINGIYKLGLLIIIVKFFPQILSLLNTLK